VVAGIVVLQSLRLRVSDDDAVIAFVICDRRAVAVMTPCVCACREKSCSRDCSVSSPYSFRDEVAVIVAFRSSECFAKEDGPQASS